MPVSRARRSGSVKWNQTEGKKFYHERFTVKDVLRMFNLTLRHRDTGESPENSHDRRLLAMMPEIGTHMIMSDIELVKGLHSNNRRSEEILTVPSDSVSNLFAVSDTPLKQEEEMVEQEVHDLFVRSLKHRALPNSLYKKPPKLFPPPELTYEEIMEDKMLKAYYDLYVIPRPRPKYPILPPRNRPPPVPVEPKKKKGKKGKTTKKPEEPLDVTKWRKENLPVASTRLWAPWFKPALFHQYTPALSLPPTPPGGVPQPVSRFGHFVNTIPNQRTVKTVSNKGHYSVPRGHDSVTRGHDSVTRGQSMGSSAATSNQPPVRLSIEDELMDLFSPLSAPAAPRGLARSGSRLLTTSPSMQLSKSHVPLLEAHSSVAHLPSVSANTVEHLTRSITGFK
ncbi:uncharacterized protein [Littorina saxatilis]|uniref:Uncharacterized protein n=1 Tax=Littorina saxatilis TaxID=31220 RepID=A0AAN9ATY7_9CAEN